METAQAAPSCSGLLGSRDVKENTSALAALPSELLLQVLARLDAVTLANCARVKTFRGADKPSGLRLVERAAMEALEQRCGDGRRDRWRHMSWLERLFVECSNVGFDHERGERHGFQFLPAGQEASRPLVKLYGMGPKLLVSDLSTFDQPYLRWRLCVRGSAAVEFGMVPVHLQDYQKVLHKPNTVLTSGAHPVGIASMITVGSELHNQVSLMKGSAVELLARRGRLDILITNPPDGQELYWSNGRTVPKTYTGPNECRLTLELPSEHDVKLALTCWAHGAFEVLHPLERADPAPVPRPLKAPVAGQLVLHGDATVGLRQANPFAPHALCSDAGCGASGSGASLGLGKQPWHSSSAGEQATADSCEGGSSSMQRVRQYMGSSRPSQGSDGGAGSSRGGSMTHSTRAAQHPHMRADARQQLWPWSRVGLQGSNSHGSWLNHAAAAPVDTPGNTAGHAELCCTIDDGDDNALEPAEALVMLSGSPTSPNRSSGASCTLL